MDTPNPLLLDLLGPASAPIILALTELLGRAVPTLPRRVLPLVAICVGVVVNVYLALATGTSPVEGVGLGVLAALIAVGAYSASSNLRGPAPTSEDTQRLVRVR